MSVLHLTDEQRAHFMAGLISGRRISAGRPGTGFGGSTTTELTGPVKPGKPVGEVLHIPTKHVEYYTIEYVTKNSGTIVTGSDLEIYITGITGAAAYTVVKISFALLASNINGGIHYKGRWLLSPWNRNDRPLESCPMFSTPILSYTVTSPFSLTIVEEYVPSRVEGNNWIIGHEPIYNIDCNLSINSNTRIKIADVHVNYAQSATYSLKAGGEATIPFKKFNYGFGSNVISRPWIGVPEAAYMKEANGDVLKFSKGIGCGVHYDEFNGDIQAEYDFCHQWYGKLGRSNADRTPEQPAGTPDSTLTVTATAISDAATTIKFTYGPRTYTVPINEGQTQIQFIIDTSGADGSYALRYSVEDGEVSCELSNITVTTQGSETVFVQPGFNRRTEDQLSLVDTAVISINSNETPDAEDELNLVDNTELTVIAPPPAPACSDKLDLIDNADITVIPPPPVPDHSDQLSLADEASIIVTSPPNPDAASDNLNLQDNAVLTV